MTHDSTPFEPHDDRNGDAADRALWRRAADSDLGSEAPASDDAMLNDLAAMLEGQVTGDERSELEDWLAADPDRSALLGAVPEAVADVRPLVLERARSLVAHDAPVVEVMTSRSGNVLRWIGSVAASVVVGVLGYTMGTTSPAPAAATPEPAGVAVIQTANVELVTAMSFGTLDASGSDNDLSSEANEFFAFDDMGGER